jgi:hypothetical protein
MNTKQIIEQFYKKFRTAKQHTDEKFANFNQGLNSLSNKYRKAWEKSLKKQEQDKINYQLQTSQ